jgi:hypothetical protein
MGSILKMVVVTSRSWVIFIHAMTMTLLCGNFDPCFHNVYFRYLRLVGQNELMDWNP